MEAARASGFSLWLMPEGEPASRLAARIDGLAARFLGQGFPPHLTLLSGIGGDGGDVLARTRELARELSPFTVRLAGVAGRDEHFRCLFVEAVPDDELVAAHLAAARAFGGRPDAGFLPHVSLFYGRLGPGRKQALARELAEAAGLSFEVRRLHAWRTEGPVSAWAAIGAADLARRP